MSVSGFGSQLAVAALAPEAVRRRKIVARRNGLHLPRKNFSGLFQAALKSPTKKHTSTAIAVTCCKEIAAIRAERERCLALADQKIREPLQFDWFRKECGSEALGFLLDDRIVVPRHDRDLASG